MNAAPTAGTLSPHPPQPSARAEGPAAEAEAGNAAALPVPGARRGPWPGTAAPKEGAAEPLSLSRAMENCPLGATRNCPLLG
jgi:hypothetical protein